MPGLRARRRRLGDDPPAPLNNGGIIRPGYSAELDGIEHSVRDAKRWVANLERVERDRTGIRNLKVGYNKVFGYYLEITKANLDPGARGVHPQADPGERRALYHAGAQGAGGVDPQRADRTQELEAALFADLVRDLSAGAERCCHCPSRGHPGRLPGPGRGGRNYGYVRPTSAPTALSRSSSAPPGGGAHSAQCSVRANDTRLTDEEPNHIITGPT